MKPSKKHSESNVKFAVGFLLGILFDPEDGSDIFVRHTRRSSRYMTLQPRKPFFSLSSV
jgi:hypothetical protein